MKASSSGHWSGSGRSEPDVPSGRWTQQTPLPHRGRGTAGNILNRAQSGEGVRPYRTSSTAAPVVLKDFARFEEFIQQHIQQRRECQKSRISVPSVSGQKQVEGRRFRWTSGSFSQERSPLGTTKSNESGHHGRRLTQQGQYPLPSTIRTCRGVPPFQVPGDWVRDHCSSTDPLPARKGH